MVAHIIDTQVIETLGEINYNLLCELTELWLMKDYFARKNAFLAFCIMKPGSPSVRMTSWQGDLSDPMISGKIVNEAMSSYIEVPQKFHADQRGSSYIYYDIALIKDAKIIGTNHCFILRFEDYSVFAFAYNDTSIEPDIMRMVMFEYSYGVCRILARWSRWNTCPISRRLRTFAGSAAWM